MTKKNPIFSVFGHFTMAKWKKSPKKGIFWAFFEHFTKAKWKKIGVFFPFFGLFLDILQWQNEKNRRFFIRKKNPYFFHFAIENSKEKITLEITKSNNYSSFRVKNAILERLLISFLLHFILKKFFYQDKVERRSEKIINTQNPI